MALYVSSSGPIKLAASCKFDLLYFLFYQIKMQAPMEMIENVMVYVPLVVGAVIFTAMMLIDRQKSLKIEAIICVLLGTALLICPQCTASIQVHESIVSDSLASLGTHSVPFKKITSRFAEAEALTCITI